MRSFPLILAMVASWGRSMHMQELSCTHRDRAMGKRVAMTHVASQAVYRHVTVEECGTVGQVWVVWCVCLLCVGCICTPGWRPGCGLPVMWARKCGLREGAWTRLGGCKSTASPHRAVI